MNIETPIKARKNTKNFRISDEGERLLLALSAHLGVKQIAVIEIALRRMADAEGIARKPEAPDEA